MAIVTRPERATSSRFVDARAERTAQIATRIAIGCAVLVGATAVWWASSAPPAGVTPAPVTPTSDPLARAVHEALAAQPASVDRVLVSALQSELGARESAQAMLDRMSPAAREAHNRDVTNRVGVPEQAARGAAPADQLRQSVHRVVATAPARTDARDTDLVTALRPEIGARENETRTVVVQPSDTLSAIAARAYGDPNKYARIFEANPRVLTSPHQLFIGMVLRVPQ